MKYSARGTWLPRDEDVRENVGKREVFGPGSAMRHSEYEDRFSFEGYRSH
jgi:hypothetical protein